MKKVLVVMILGLFLGGAFIPGSISLVVKESCCTDGWVYDEDNATWSIEFSGQINASFIKTFGILGKNELGVIFSHEYSFSNESQGYIEISYNRGDTWAAMKVFNSTSSSIRDIFITLNSESLWVRFTVESKGGNGYWRVWDIDIIGDTRGEPPISGCKVQGTWEVDWEPFNYYVTIRSYDTKCGVKEIHYILFGKETVVPGNIAEFSVNKDGIHFLVYWAVDNCGNEETPHITPPFMHIDHTPPTIEITTPEPGLYLFGKKMDLSTDKLIFIGGFTLEATAQDKTSGVCYMEFYLDGEVYAYITEKPYEAYCNLKHRGKGTITASGVDYAGNYAEDTLDIVYYKFR